MSFFDTHVPIKKFYDKCIKSYFYNVLLAIGKFLIQSITAVSKQRY